MKKVLAMALSLCLMVSLFCSTGLLVSADPGDYTMNESESNSTLNTADRIYNNYTVNGVVSGTDMDYFKFSLSSRSTINIVTLATYKSCFVAGVITSSEDFVAVSSFVEYSASGYPSYLTTATLDAGTYYYVIFNADASSLRNTYMFYFEYSVVGSGHTHYYSNECDATCNGCDYVRSVSHTYDGDCDALCNVCYNTRTALSDHTYTNACDTLCNVCSQQRTAPHVYDSVCDLFCNECDKRNENPHDFADATCIAPQTCKLCGLTYGDKTGHTYEKKITTATTTKDGKIENLCTVCGYKSSKVTTIYKASSIKLSKTSYTYNGKTQKPSVEVKDSQGKPVSSKYYTVTYASGCKNVGTYKVTVKFKGNYSGTKTLTYKINPINVSKCKITLSKTSYTYNGKAQKPSVTVKNANGTKLTTSSYTVTYASGRKNVGTYKVTVKMKGNYTGTKTLTFKVNPPKTSLSKLTDGKTSLKVTYTKKTSQVTGYQIQYSTSSSFKSYKTKTVSNYKTASATLTGLKTKTNYYVRIRTYKTVGKTKYYSAWSSVKTKCTTHTHSYSKATCTKAKTCKYCKATSGKALGHTKNTVNCKRCGKVVFKTLTFSGVGIKKFTNISLPEGDFILTMVISGVNKEAIGYCIVNLYGDDSRLDAFVGEAIYSSDSGKTKSDKDTFEGPMKNGTLKIEAKDNIKWTITITPY